MLLGIIGGTELIVILVIALLIFGGKKIPELMRGIGRGVREYKNGLNDINNPDDDSSKKSESGDKPSKDDNTK